MFNQIQDVWRKLFTGLRSREMPWVTKRPKRSRSTHQVGRFERERQRRRRMNKIAHASRMFNYFKTKQQKGK